jgi:hypothetical protein
MMVVSDEDDRIIFQKPLANKLYEILMALAPHKEEIIGMAVKSTYKRGEDSVFSQELY